MTVRTGVTRAVRIFASTSARAEIMSETTDYSLILNIAVFYVICKLRKNDLYQVLQRARKTVARRLSLVSDGGAYP